MVIDLSSFIPTSLATLLGVGVAFILNGIYHSWHHNWVERKQARRLLYLLKFEIELNGILLPQLETDYKKLNYTPYYDLQFVVWNSITPNLMTVLKKPNIIKDLSEFYYELQHIERKVNGVFNLSHSPNINPQIMLSRQQLVISLLQHIPTILSGEKCKSPKELVCEIKHLIKELK